MRLLLDTHVLLWSLNDDPTLSASTRSLLVDGTHNILVSAASAWEIAIKQKLGKLAAPHDLHTAVEASGFEWLTISPRHALAAGNLPLLHSDPFDRMLVAQAQCEGLTLVTRDLRLAAYGVPVLNA